MDSLLTVIDKDELSEYVPQDYPVHSLLERDQPSSIDVTAVIQTANYLLRNPFTHSQMMPIVMEVGLFTTYVTARVAELAPRLLAAFTAHRKHSVEELAIENALACCLKALNDVHRRLRASYQKYVNTLSTASLQHLTVLLVFSDHLQLRYEILRLGQLVSLSLPGEFSQPHGDLADFDEVSLVGRTKVEYVPLKPPIKESLLLRMDFSRVAFVGNCYLSMALHLKDLGQANLNEMACRYRLYRNFTSSEQSVRESLLLEHLFVRQELQEDAEWLLWQLDELAGTFSSQTIVRLQEFYHEVSRLTFTISSEQVYTKVRNTIEGEVARTDTTLTQEHLRRIFLALLLTSIAAEYRPGEEWLVRAKLALESRLFDFFISLFQRPTDAIDVLVLHNFFESYTFSECSHHQQLFEVITRLDKYDPRHRGMGLGLLLDKVYRGTLESYLHEKPQWKRWMYTSNLYLFGLLLKLSNFTMHFSPEHQVAVASILRLKKARIYPSILQEIIQYYVPKGQLQLELKEYIMARPFTTVVEENTADIEVGLFTCREKLQLYKQIADRCKTQHRATQRSIAGRYSNGLLRTALLATYEAVVSEVIATVFGDGVAGKCQADHKMLFAGRIDIAMNTLYTYENASCDGKLWHFLKDINTTLLKGRPHTEVITPIIASSYREGFLPQHPLGFLLVEQLAKGRLTYHEISQELLLKLLLTELADLEKDQVNLQPEDVAFLIKYMLDEFEQEYIARISESIRRRFSPATTREQTTATKEEFKAQVPNLEDLWRTKWRDDFSLENLDGVGYDRSLLKEETLTNWLHDQLQDLLAIEGVQQIFLADLRSLNEKWQPQPPTVNTDAELFLDCVKQFMRFGAHLQQQTEEDLAVWLKVANNMLETILPHLDKLADTTNYCLMSSLRNFVMERVKDSTEVYKKVVTRHQWELFQQVCTNTMRLSGFQHNFIDDVFSAAKTQEKKKRKRGRRDKSTTKAARQFSSADVRKYVEGWLNELQWPTTSTQVKNIHDALKAVSADEKQVKVRLTKMNTALEKEATSSAYSLRRHLNVLLLQRSLAKKDKVAAIDHQLLRLMCHKQFPSTAHDDLLLYILRAAERPEIVEVQRAVQPQLELKLSAKSATHSDRLQLSWCLLLQLNCDVVLTVAGKADVVPRYYTQLLLENKLFEATEFPTYDVLFLEQLRELRANLRHILRMQTVRFVFEGLYELPQKSDEKWLVKVLAAHSNEIMQSVPFPYRVFTETLQTTFKAIIKDGKFTRQETGNPPVKFYWALVEGSRSKLSNEQFIHTALLNTLPYFPHTVLAMLKVRTAAQLVSNIERTAPFLTAVCKQLIYAFPQYFLEVVEQLCSRMRQCKTDSAVRELKTTFDVFLCYAENLMEAPLPSLFSRIEACYNAIKSACCCLLGGLTFDRMTILKDLDQFSELVQFLPALDARIKFYKQYGAVLSSFEPHQQYDELLNLYDGVEPPDPIKLNARGYLRNVGQSWNDPPAEELEKRGFEHLSKWLVSTVTKDAAPADIYQQPLAEGTFEQGEFDADGEMQEEDNQSEAASEGYQLSSYDGPKTRKERYLAMSQQQQQQHLAQLLEGNSGGDFSAEELLSFVKFDPLEIVCAKDIRETISEWIKEEVRLRQKQLKKVMAMLEQFLLDPREPFQSKLFQEFVEGSGKLLEKMDNGCVLQQMAMGKLPPESFRLEQVSSTLTKLQEKYGWYSQSRNLPWYESEGNEQERLARRDAQWEGMEEKLENGKKTIKAVRKPTVQESASEMESQGEQVDEEDGIEHNSEQQHHQTEEQSSLMEIEEPQSSVTQLLPEDQPLCQSLQQAKDLLTSVLKSKQFKERQLDALPDELVVFQLFCALDNSRHFRFVCFSHALQVVSLLWRLTVAALNGTDREVLQILRGDTSAEQFTTKLVKAVCREMLLFRELDNTSTNYTLQLWTRLDDSVEDGGTAKPNTSVTVEVVPVRIFRLKEQPTVTLLQLPTFAKNKLITSRVEEAIQDYLFYGVGKLPEAFPSTKGTAFVGQRIRHNVLVWLESFITTSQFKCVLSLFGRDYRVEELRKYTAGAGLHKFYVDVARIALQFATTAIRKLMASLDRCQKDGVIGYNLIELYDAQKQLVEGELLKDLTSDLNRQFWEGKQHLAREPIFWQYAQLQVQVWLRYYQSTACKEKITTLNLQPICRIINASVEQQVRSKLSDDTDLKGEVRQRLKFEGKPTVDLQLEPMKDQRSSRFQVVLDELRNRYQLMDKVSGLTIFNEHASTQDKLKAIRTFLAVDNVNTVTLDRRAIWLSTVKHFLEVSPKKMRIHQFDVNYVDEDGIDGGGPHNEWVSKMLEEVLDPARGLFALTTENYLMPSRIGKAVIAHRLHYRIFGRLLAKFFLEDDAARCVPFCPYMWKLLKGQPVALSDLASVDPFMHRNLVWLLEHTIDSSYELTFSVSYEMLGVHHTHPLVEGGQKLLVDDTNKHQYVARLVHWHLVDSVYDQLYELLLGWLEVCPPVLLQYFSAEELAEVMNRNDRFDVEEFARDAVLKNCDRTTDEITWLVEVLREMNGEELAKFTEFVTGRRRLGADRFREWTVQLECKPDQLPYSATCSSRLVISVIRNKDGFRRKLWQAMNECEGFFRS